VTPHKSGNRGTFILDRKTRIGRIAVASGTTHLPTFRRLNEMLTALSETGRSDLLREIREGRLKPLQVYEAFRTSELHKLPLGAELKPLKETLEAWLETVECSTAQRAAHKTMINKLTEHAAGTVGDLPGRLVLVGLDCRKKKTPAQFNRVRASVLSFIRDTLKRSHRLYGEIRDIPLMKEKKAPHRQPQTWAQLVAHANKMQNANPRYRNAMWAMALTGMGPKEYFIDGWELLADRVVVLGVKRAQRSRAVPRVRSRYYTGLTVGRIVGKEREMRLFGEVLHEQCGIHPYDLRRTYANWLEAAGVPRTRRKLYMGHAGGDVTSLYEQHEVEQFLTDDARKLEAYLAQPSITSHITKRRGKHA
jgi:hypothetical protein